LRLEWKPHGTTEMPVREIRERNEALKMPQSKYSTKRPRTWVQIRNAIGALRQEGVPLEVLTSVQIFKRFAN